MEAESQGIGNCEGTANDSGPQCSIEVPIAEDLTHSHGEKRYYCIGRVGHGVLTVRFTYREGVIRIIGAGYWRRGKRIYEEQS